MTEDFVLFCGVPVGSRISRLLAELGPANRRYISGEPFLSMRNVGEKQVLGRPVDAGLPIVELEDFGRNVRSILRKVFPEERLPESDVRLYVVTRTAPDVAIEPDAAEPESPVDEI
jgi:hypothetical protein